MRFGGLQQRASSVCEVYSINSPFEQWPGCFRNREDVRNRVACAFSPPDKVTMGGCARMKFGERLIDSFDFAN